MGEGYGSGRMRAGVHREFTYLLELTGITAVVVAQPVFNIVQAAPEELVARRARPLEIVAFALVVVLVPPLLLWLGELGVRLVAPRARDAVHGVVVGVGVGLFATEVLKSVLGREARPWLALVGIAVAVLASLALIRRPAIRLLPRYLAFAAPAFLALFLFASPIGDLVVGSRVEAVDVDVGNPVPVVLIALDEFPEVSILDGEGGIDAPSYPAFARLASDSTWFRNNTGVSPLTPSALPAILTGQLPEELFPAPVSTRFNQSIFTLLGGSYDVRATENLTAVCPPDICAHERATSAPDVVESLLRTGLNVFGSVASPWVDQRSLEFVVNRAPNDPLAPSRMTEFARQLQPRDQPTLDFLHVLMPHQPWDWLASGRTYVAPDPPRSAEFGSWFDQTTADEGRQRHLLQLRYTDHLLGGILDRLEASGLYDDALIIVTADHGIGFVGGEPLRAVSEANYPQVMWTPLFVKVPGQTEPAVDDRTVETIDIVPTIADVLDVDIPWDVDGASVFEERDDRPARMIDWRFNTVEAETVDGFVVLDRQAGFDQVLAGSNPAAGHPDDPDAVLRLGPYGPLIGSLVSDATVGPPAGIEVMTTAQPTFTVSRDATDLPAYVEGVWPGPTEGWIAVAVDGTIAGVGRSYPQGDFATFWAMLTERLLTPGEHQLALYAASGPVTAPTLRPLAMVPPNP
jgi:Sulfatase